MSTKKDNNPTKKQKTEGTANPTAYVDDQDPEMMKKMNKLDELNERIEKLSAEADEEIIQVEQKYWSKKKPIFKERNDIIKTIPHFWKQTLVNCPDLNDYFTGTDEQLLDCIEELNIEMENIKEGFSVHLKFKPNQWFKDTNITITVKNDEEAGPTVTHSKIDWKPNMNLEEKADADGFFVGLLNDAEVLHMLQQDVWPVATSLYFGLTGVEDAEQLPEEEEEEEEEDQ